jgi:hypothetical protein
MFFLREVFDVELLLNYPRYADDSLEGDVDIK